MKHPTPNQILTMEAVYDHWVRQGYPPTLRQLADGLGIGTHAVWCRLHWLREKGLLEPGPRFTARARLALSDAGLAALGRPRPGRPCADQLALCGATAAHEAFFRGLRPGAIAWCVSDGLTVGVILQEPRASAAQA